MAKSRKSSPPRRTVRNNRVIATSSPSYKSPFLTNNTVRRTTTTVKNAPPVRRTEGPKDTSLRLVSTVRVARPTGHGNKETKNAFVSASLYKEGVKRCLQRGRPDPKLRTRGKGTKPKEFVPWCKK